MLKQISSYKGGIVGTSNLYKLVIGLTFCMLIAIGVQGLRAQTPDSKQRENREKEQCMEGSYNACSAFAKKVRIVFEQ